MDKWHGTGWRERPHYGTTLQAGETRGIQALLALLELAAAPATPAIVRATAATLAQPHASPATLPATLALLQDGDPSVRIAALGMLAPLDEPTRLRAAAPLLGDPVRGVRIEAANLLADLPDSDSPIIGGPSARRRCRTMKPRSRSMPTGRRSTSISATCACARGAPPRR
jgi:HEAT repeat protein